MLGTPPKPTAAGQSAPLAPLAAGSLAEALIHAMRAKGAKAEAIEDPDRKPLTYRQLVLGALVLGRKLAGFSARGERVAVLLPNVNGLAVTLFGLTFFGRVAVLLNFTAGARNLTSACATAGIRTIVTSRRFIEQARLEDLMAAISEKREVLFLEDVRAGLTRLDKLKGAASLLVAGLIARRSAASPDDPAVVLFTSGSEGQPKGVVLSHRNLITNAAQIFAHAAGALSSRDILFNPLPAFHSFGLTAGTLLGLFNGMKVVFYPSPLHYRQVPKLIGASGATVLLATDTFLQGYARAAEGDDIARVRVIVAGAERVKDETRRLWGKHGTIILEGYGCTECAPVLACNLPEDNRPGTVGRFLPGLSWRLDPVAGIEGGGRLSVKGANVMAGYLLPGKEGAREAPPEGWHDTGDIVGVDEDGFVTIKGRAKRFAKIGGEMISLAAVETLAAGLWPGATHVAVTLPDPRKGEQIVLVSDWPNADRETLAAHVKAQGVPELWAPRAILVVGAIPVLGSGKVDYAGAGELARSMRAMI